MQMPLLLSHPRLLEDLYPPIDAIEALIDKQPTHWYWEGDFHIDPFSRTPVFRWSPAGTRRSGLYVVARLLWAAAHPGEQKRLQLRNKCGVYACVNPEHWEDINRPRLWTLPDDADAELLRSRAATVVHDAVDGTYEGVRTVQERVHVRSNGSHFAVCGAAFRHGQGVCVVDPCLPITCEACLKEWRGLGRPLKEIT